MRKKILFCFFAMMLFIILLIGCTKNQQEEAPSDMVENVTIKVWCPQNQIDIGIIDLQQRQFTELHPEWNITWYTEVVGEDKAKETILRDVDAAADVFLFTSDQLVELVNAGAIARLGGETEKMVHETMPEEVAETVIVENGVYGIPFTHNTFYLYYDKTLLDEEEIKTMESIMEKDHSNGVYNFYFESAGGWKLGSFYYGAGLHVFGENGEDQAAGVNWNNETGVAVTEYLIDLINNPKCAYEGEIAVTELIASHRLGAWFDGAWNDEAYQNLLGENLGRAKLPTFHIGNEDYQLRSFYGTKCIGVNTKAEHMQAAVAFAAFLGNEENQMLRFERSSQIPTNLTLLNSEIILQDPLAAVMIQEVTEASVKQPGSVLFSSRYWNYANTIPTEIRSRELNRSNLQQKLDRFVEVMTAE